MDRHWIKFECGACKNVADIRVEENDPPRLYRHGPERRAIHVAEGCSIIYDGKTVQCACGERMPV